MLCASHVLEQIRSAPKLNISWEYKADGKLSVQADNLLLAQSIVPIRILLFREFLRLPSQTYEEPCKRNFLFRFRFPDYNLYF